jgi:hypothetical protein
MSTTNKERDEDGEAEQEIEQRPERVADLPAAVWAGVGVVGEILVAMGAWLHAVTLTFGGLPRLSVILSA